MAKRDAVHQRYVIPENMIDGGKIMGFKTRNVVEGLVLGGIVGLFSYGLLPFEEFSMRFSFTVVLAAPFLALGVVGISGYPLTYFLKVAYQWFQTRGVLLYDHSVRLLEVSLLENRMNQTDLRDKVFDIYEKHIVSTRNKDKGKAMIEGVDFKFAQDKEEQAVMVTKNIEEPVLVAEDGEDEEASFLLPGEEMPAEGPQEPTEDLVLEGEETDVSFVEIAPAPGKAGEEGESEPIEPEEGIPPHDEDLAPEEAPSAVAESDGKTEEADSEEPVAPEQGDAAEADSTSESGEEKKENPSSQSKKKRKKKKKKGAGSR